MLTKLMWILKLCYCFFAFIHLSLTWNGFSTDTCFCLCPLDRLIKVFQAFHIQNLFRMLHYQLLSNVEQTFSLLELCVLVDLRIRQTILPKMDGGFHRRRYEHSPYQLHLFRKLALRMLRRLMTFPISFAESERSCSCIDGS